MTQEYVTPYTFHLGDGTSTTFPYPWRIRDASDLQVYLQGVLTTAYTVTGLDEATGGNVIMVAPPVVGTIVYLRRKTPQTQLTDYTPNDPFDAVKHEGALDKLTREIQDFAEILSRLIALPVDAPSALRNLVFPLPGAGKVIGWSADGTSLTLYPSILQEAIVQPSSGEAHGQLTVDVVSVPGADHLTASALIPPGVELAGVGYRVTRGFSSELGLASIDLGGLGVTSRWGAGLGISMETVNNAGQWVGGRVFTTTAGDVVLLANPPGARFGLLGTVRLTAFFTVWVPH